MVNYYYYLLDSRQLRCHEGEFSIGMRRDWATDCFYGAILIGHRNLIIQSKALNVLHLEAQYDAPEDYNFCLVLNYKMTHKSYEAEYKWDMKVVILLMCQRKTNFKK